MYLLYFTNNYSHKYILNLTILCCMCTSYKTRNTYDILCNIIKAMIQVGLVENSNQLVY